jgi:hypothetical protein
MDEKQRDARWARKHLGRQPELDRHDALAAYHVQRGRAKFWKRIDLLEMHTVNGAAKASQIDAATDALRAALDAHAADQRRADQIGPVGEPA